MFSNRDDFSKVTIEILAKRVGYLCSSPNCKKFTVGANEISTKSTSIGIAAHITAAAIGGPRYDESLTPEQRRHIDNGIWLCSNCATLIDRDENYYTVLLLKRWKEDAEVESKNRLSGEAKDNISGTPYLEADLIGGASFRVNRGYSDKNPIEMLDGQAVRIIGTNAIIYWLVNRNFDFVIYNNSNYPAFNIKLESTGTTHFTQLSTLPKVNNLPPLKNIDLKAIYEEFIEGDYTVADEILNSKIPEKFSDIVLKLTYYDEKRNIHTNFIEFKKDEIINTKI